MADEPDQASDADEQPRKKGLPKTLIIVLAVALVEGGAFFAGIKIFGGGPEETYGQDGEHALAETEADTEVASAEVCILKKFKVPNHKTGRTYVYDFDISVKVPASRQEEMQALVESRSSEIADRVAQIVRGAEARELTEYDFKTLRSKLKQAFAEIVGEEDFIRRVLIPRCVPIPGG